MRSQIQKAEKGSGSQKEHLGPHHYLGVLVEGELVAKGGGLLSLVNTCGEIGLEYQIYPPSSPII